MKFSYKGRSASGEIVSGILTADTKGDAIASIRDMGVTPMAVTEKKVSHGMVR